MYAHTETEHTFPSIFPPHTYNYMLLLTRAVVLEYKTGSWGGKTARFIGHYTALLDGKVPEYSFFYVLQPLFLLSNSTKRVDRTRRFSRPSIKTRLRRC